MKIYRIGLGDGSDILREEISTDGVLAIEFENDGKPRETFSVAIGDISITIHTSTTMEIRPVASNAIQITQRGYL